MTESITLLEAVCHTMDSIAIVGVDNQDKFVGCVNAIRTVLSRLNELNTSKEESDG